MEMHSRHAVLFSFFFVFTVKCVISVCLICLWNRGPCTSFLSFQ